MGDAVSFGKLISAMHRSIWQPSVTGISSCRWAATRSQILHSEATCLGMVIQTMYMLVIRVVGGHCPDIGMSRHIEV